MFSSREFWLIVGMMAVTFGVRYPTLALIGRFNLRKEIIQALRYVPVAVLTALTVPYVLFRDNQLDVSYTNPYMVGGVIAVIVSYWTKNLLLTIVIGLAAFFGYRLLLGI